MGSGLLIIMSLILYSIFVTLIFYLSRIKHFKPYEEYKIVIFGSSEFIYTSWLVIYRANVKSFVGPVFKKGFLHMNYL